MSSERQSDWHYRSVSFAAAHRSRVAPIAYSVARCCAELRTVLAFGYGGGPGKVVGLGPGGQPDVDAVVRVGRTDLEFGESPRRG